MMNQALFLTIGSAILFSATFILLTLYMNRKARLRSERIKALRSKHTEVAAPVLSINPVTDVALGLLNATTAASVAAATALSNKPKRVSTFISGFETHKQMKVG